MESLDHCPPPSFFQKKKKKRAECTSDANMGTNEMLLHRGCL